EVVERRGVRVRLDRHPRAVVADAAGDAGLLRGPIDPRTEAHTLDRPQNPDAPTLQLRDGHTCVVHQRKRTATVFREVFRPELHGPPDIRRTAVGPKPRPRVKFPVAA